MITPMPGELIVEIIEDIVKETESGILIADPKFHGLPKHGKVCWVGKGVDKSLVGKKVLYKEDNPQGFWFEDVAMMRIKEDQLQGVYE